MALNGLRVSGTDLEDRVAKLAAGTTVTIHAFRRDELITTTLTVGQPVADTAFFELVEEVSDEVLARRQAWLGLDSTGDA